jgi:hypothetical protein
MANDIRVYVEGKGATVAAGITALDVIRATLPEEAELVAGGEKVITDGRGLPIDQNSQAYAGAIFRIVRAREERGRV